MDECTMINFNLVIIRSLILTGRLGRQTVGRPTSSRYNEGAVMTKADMLYKQFVSDVGPVKRKPPTYDKAPPKKVARTDDKPKSAKSKNVENRDTVPAHKEHNIMYQLSPLMQQFLDNELDNLMEKVIHDINKEEPKSPADKVIFNKYKEKTGPLLKNTIGLNVTKRLLNHGDRLIVKLQFSAPPSGMHLRNFITKYRLHEFKKMPPRNTYVAVVKNFSDLDRLTTTDLTCGIINVKVKPCIPFLICPPNLKSEYKTKLRELLSDKGTNQKNDNVENVEDNKTTEKDSQKGDKNEKDSSKLPDKSKTLDSESTQKAQETSNVQKSEPPKENKQTQATNTQKSQELNKVTNVQTKSQEISKQTISQDSVKQKTQETTKTISPNKAQETTKTVSATKTQETAQNNTKVETKTDNQTKSQDTKPTPTKTQETQKSNVQTKQQDQKTKPEETATTTSKPQEATKTPLTKPATKPQTKTVETKLQTKSVETKTLTKPSDTKTPTKTSEAKTQPKVTKPVAKKTEPPKKLQTTKKETVKSTPNKNTKDKKRKSSDFDELDDQDILALLSGGIVLDECSGSDDE